MPDSDQTKKDELRRLATETGNRALALFREFKRERLSPAELQAGLRQLDTAGIMTQYWEILSNDPQCAPCFEILQLLSSLEQEMPYQLDRYGETSLWDDLTELQSAVKRVGREGHRSATA